MKEKKKAETRMNFLVGLPILKGGRSEIKRNEITEYFLHLASMDDTADVS